MKEEKIISKLSEAYTYDFATLTLLDGTKVEGQSWDLYDATNDDGDELGYEILIFEVDGTDDPLILKEEDIIEVKQLIVPINGV